MWKIKILAGAICTYLLFGIASSSIGSPVVDQTGNLIINGNFESPLTLGWRTNSDGLNSRSTNYAVDGSYSALIDTHNSGTDSFGNFSTGLWKYAGELTPGYYTVSAWFLPIKGQAYIGLQWNYLPDPLGQAF